MRAVNATTGRSLFDSHPATIRMYAALTLAGFRRYATYRQATVASAVTNSVFGFVRCAAILAAAAGAGGVAAGYGGAQLVTFVWAGQGLLGTVGLWMPLDLSERIRTGDVICDLLRPVDPVWRDLATDLGRAGFGALTRFPVQMVVGALAFDMYVPARWETVPFFALSVLLASVICFACRYLVHASAFWLLDARGSQIIWSLISLALTGMAFPLRFLPDWSVTALTIATPLPSLIQLPLDILAERTSLTGQLQALAIQVAWAVTALALCQVVRRRAERRMVIQGG